MNIDKTLEEFDKLIPCQHCSGNNMIPNNIKNFLIKAIITEYKSLREEIVGNPASPSYQLFVDGNNSKEYNSGMTAGYHHAIKEQIANLDKKIINLESKLK
jgi:hypothetical protein